MDRTLVIILAAALVGRVALPIVSCALNGDTSRFHANDTDSYLLPAAGLLEDGTLGRDGHPEVIRTPGYSLFLVPGLLLGSVDWVTVFLQALLGTLTVFLVHRVTRSHFGGTSAALFAAGICVLEPLSVVYCGMLLTETIFTTLLVLFLCAILQHLKSGHSACLLVAAVTLSACAYVRPDRLPVGCPGRGRSAAPLRRPGRLAPTRPQGPSVPRGRGRIGVALADPERRHDRILRIVCNLRH